MILPPTSEISHHLKVTNITMSPASLLYLIITIHFIGDSKIGSSLVFLDEDVLFITSNSNSDGTVWYQKIGVSLEIIFYALQII